MNNRFVIIIIAAAMFASCGKEVPSPEPHDGTVGLELEISLPQGGSQEVSARTRVAVSQIRPDTYLYLYSLHTKPDMEDNIEWYHTYLGYDNIRVQASWSPISGANPRYDYSSCIYTPRGVTNYMGKIGFFPTKGPVTLYGVHPYMPDFHTVISDLEHIPFNVGYMIGDVSSTVLEPNYIYDYMYMVDGDPDSDNYLEPINFDMEGMEPGKTKTMKTHFKHVMTTVELRLKTTLVGAVYVDSIALDAFVGGERASVFARNGTFSAVDGSITSRERFTSHLSMTGNRGHAYGSMTLLYYKYRTDFNPDYYSPFAFIFPAVEHTPGLIIRATIYISRYNNGTTNDNSLLDMEGQVCVMEFPLDNILTDPDGDGPLPAANLGLMQGFRYVYAAEVDNFIKYSGYPDIEDWRLPVDDPNHPNYGQIKDIVI